MRSLQEKNKQKNDSNFVSWVKMKVELGDDPSRLNGLHCTPTLS